MVKILGKLILMIPVNNKMTRTLSIQTKHPPLGKKIVIK